MMEEERIDLRQVRQKRQRRHRHEQMKMPKSRLIMVYTVGVCLSCLYLETQQFQGLLGDSRSHYMAVLTYFDVFMCLWSYIQTIRTRNAPAKLSKLGLEGPPSQKFTDKFYSPTDKYCNLCNNFKFPRVNHCSTCGTCQYKMDHHCIWTQTCIGLNNQKPFFLFCLYMALGVFQFWYFSIRVFHERTVPFFQLMEPGLMILWFFTAFSAFFVGLMILMLFLSHTVMMLTNYRTLDAVKTRKMCPAPFVQKGADPDSLNLFDRGQLQNFKQFFGRRWWLWPFPITNDIENEIYPEAMAPHPNPENLLKQTDLYDVEMKYKKEMKRMPKLNFLSFFIGKKMKINDQIFHISPQEQS